MEYQSPDKSTLKIMTYTSPEPAFWVNSYLIETAKGLIIIDTQFTLSEAGKLLQMAQAIQKPLLAILLTHPHPDHVNGTGLLLKNLNPAPVVATQATRDAVAALIEPKRTQWKPILGDDYPDDVVLPEHIVADGETVDFDGVTFRFTDVGQIESLNESLIELPDYLIAFVGDLFYHRAHPWLVEGRTARWLKVLRDVEIRYRNYKALLPGHGLPATLSALAVQADYIENFIALVRSETASDGIISEAGQERISKALDKEYPGWALASLHGLNIAGVSAELTTMNSSH